SNEDCAGAKFVGTYEGEGIAEGKRSVTVRFEYRAPDRTLRDEEVDELHWPLVEALKKKFGAEVRCGVSEPRAYRGPRAGSPRGVVDAAGSSRQARTQMDTQCGSWHGTAFTGSR